MSSLEKVLRLSGQQPAPVPLVAEDFIRMAADTLEQLAVLLAAPPPKGKGDGDGPPWLKKGKGKKKPMPKGKKSSDDDDDDEDDDDEDDEDDEDDDDVKASRSLVLEAMVALSQVQGGELVSLSVLTQAEREKPSAHTIPGSTDYPIPDKVHLAAAVARYKQGKFAGHTQAQVKAHILKHARRLGEQVELSDAPSAEVIIGLARPATKGPFYPGKERMIAMDHGPMTGTHSHAHRVTEVHDHEHTHNGDSRHACGDRGIYDSAVY